MIDIKVLREDPELVRASQRARGEDELKYAYYEDGKEGLLKQNPAYKESEEIKKAGH